MSATFEFDSRLDTRFLDLFYEGNMDYALGLFEIYITSHSETMQKCQEVISSEDDWLMLAIAHTKLYKCSFVGLTNLNEMRIDMEKLFRQGKTAAARQIFPLIYEEFMQTFPLIQGEYKRLKDFVQQYRNR